MAQKKVMPSEGPAAKAYALARDAYFRGTLSVRELYAARVAWQQECAKVEARQRQPRVWETQVTVTARPLRGGS